MDNDTPDMDFSGLAPEQPEDGDELDLVEFIEPESDWGDEKAAEDEELPPRKIPKLKLPKLNIKAPSLSAIELTESQLRTVWAGEIAFSLIAGFAALIIALAN